MQYNVNEKKASLGNKIGPPATEIKIQKYSDLQATQGAK